jgi:hypothetical protein
MRTSRTLLASAVATSLALLGCGGGDNVAAFDIVEVVDSDCSQGESGQINCIDPATFQDVERIGRWTIETVDADHFVLTTENGRVLPGVQFANNGRILSDQCTGQGGRCFFTRSRTDTLEAQTGCVRIVDRVIDVVIQDGVLTGQRSDVQFVDDCDASNVRQQIVRVEGVEVDEPIRAREGL